MTGDPAVGVEALWNPDRAATGLHRPNEGETLKERIHDPWVLGVGGGQYRKLVRLRIATLYTRPSVRSLRGIQPRWIW
jgi:hypothetical protein